MQDPSEEPPADPAEPRRSPAKSPRGPDPGAGPFTDTPLDPLRPVQSLLVGLVHELRNVLFACSVNIEALEPEPDPGERLEIYRTIRQEHDRLAALTEDLVELSRAKPEGLQVLPLAQALEAAARAASRRAGDNEVVIEGPDQGWLVGMERARLALAFERLIQSAGRHSKGADLRILSQGFAQDGRPWVRCTVTSGTGSPAGVPLPGAFEPFSAYTASGDRLGLAVAEHIVALHGGRTSATGTSDGRLGALSVELPCA